MSLALVSIFGGLTPALAMLFTGMMFLPRFVAEVLPGDRKQPPFPNAAWASESAAGLPNSDRVASALTRWVEQPMGKPWDESSAEEVERIIEEAQVPRGMAAIAGDPAERTPFRERVLCDRITTGRIAVGAIHATDVLGPEGFGSADWQERRLAQLRAGAPSAFSERVVLNPGERVVRPSRKNLIAWQEAAKQEDAKLVAASTIRRHRAG